MSETQLSEDVSLAQRVRANPRPAVVWTVVLLFLIALEFGALASVVVMALERVASGFVSTASSVTGGPVVPSIGGAISGGLDAAGGTAQSLPTLLSRDVFPNQGHQVEPNVWEGTFLGLEPMVVWLLRVVLIYAYVFAILWWLWRGYRTYVEHYRYADWTPRDDMVRRLRGHRWGQFGMVVVVLFIGMAIFAPSISPTTAEQNIYHPASTTIEYLDEDTGELQETTVLSANLQSASQGTASTNVGVMQYDEYDRFHPFGTMPNPGQDLFTYLAYGARVSLFIGVSAIAISSILAAAFALLTAYYKGLVDLGVVMASDTIQSIPAFLLLILATVVFQNHWLGQIYSGGLLLALVFGFIRAPGLWRAVRGPAFQVSEQEWVDAAKSYGQRARNTMEKHMLPYILGYLLIYGSLSIGGVIIATAALSYLGIGIDPPTAEWGRAVANGRGYVATPSWHIALIPGILIVFVVTAFNAMGDGIRDAIDPQSEGGDAGAEAAAAGGGG